MGGVALEWGPLAAYGVIRHMCRKARVGDVRPKGAPGTQVSNPERGGLVDLVPGHLPTPSPQPTAPPVNGSDPNRPVITGIPILEPNRSGGEICAVGWGIPPPHQRRESERDHGSIFRAKTGRNARDVCVWRVGCINDRMYS